MEDGAEGRGARHFHEEFWNSTTTTGRRLSSLGYLARDAGDTKLAESYFSRAIAAHPKDFAPYLALGDLYTAERKFQPAETNYESAYQRMPDNALVIAGGANAAIEAHNIEPRPALARSCFGQGEHESSGQARARTLSNV